MADSFPTIVDHLIRGSSQKCYENRALTARAPVIRSVYFLMRQIGAAGLNLQTKQDSTNYAA